MLLNWNWIAGLTRRFFRKVAAKSRINYILNWVFFIDGVLVMLTGIMISEVVLPLFGIQVPRGSIWRQLHSLTADLSLFILGLHIALNWTWVVSIIERYIIHPITKHRPRKRIELEPARCRHKNHSPGYHHPCGRAGDFWCNTGRSERQWYRDGASIRGRGWTELSRCLQPPSWPIPRRVRAWRFQRWSR